MVIKVENNIEKIIKDDIRILLIQLKKYSKGEITDEIIEMIRPDMEMIQKSIPTRPQRLEKIIKSSENGKMIIGIKMNDEDREFIRKRRSEIINKLRNLDRSYSKFLESFRLPQENLEQY